MPFQAITFLSDYAHLWRAQTCEAPEFRRFLRMPPTAGNDDAFGHDLAVAEQVLADGVDIVELALRNRDEGGVSDAPRLEAAELRTPQRHRRIDRRSRARAPPAPPFSPCPGRWRAYWETAGTRA